MFKSKEVSKGIFERKKKYKNQFIKQVFISIVKFFIRTFVPQILERQL